MNGTYNFINDTESIVSQAFNLRAEKSGNVVHLAGLITIAGFQQNNNYVMFTLPEKYRPITSAETTIAMTMSASWNNPNNIGQTGVLITVSTSGEVSVNVGINSASNVTFLLDTTYILI